MAENTAGDKTEKASAQKLRQAREQGHVVRSRDVSTALGVVVSLKLFVALLPSYLEDLHQLFARSFAPLDSPGSLENLLSTTFPTAMWLIVKMILPLFAVPLAGVLAAFYPGGWVISARGLVPTFAKLNPAANLANLFGKKHLFDTALALAKATVIGAVLWHVSKSSADDYLRLQGMSFAPSVLAGADLMLGGIMSMAMVFVLFACIDLPVQTYLFMQKQRMSKQDLKDEHQSNEGRPEIKARVRQLQRALSKRSINKTVPTADVVIVNPEHYAVALKYDEDRAEAPYVVAKGVDEMALYIREIAAAHGIETVPLPPLARAIYNTSQVNQQIPMPLYAAVAQVLTYVLQIKAFRTGRRVAEPTLPSDLAVPTSLSEATLT